MTYHAIVRGAYLQTNAFMQQTLGRIDTARNLTKILWEPFVSYFHIFIFENGVPSSRHVRFSLEGWTDMLCGHLYWYFVGVKEVLVSKW